MRVVVVDRRDDAVGRRRPIGDLADQIHAGAIRQVQVDEHEIEPRRFDGGARVRDAVDGRHLDSGEREHEDVGKPVPRGRQVLDDEGTLHGESVSVTGSGVRATENRTWIPRGVRGEAA